MSKSSGYDKSELFTGERRRYEIIDVVSADPEGDEAPEEPVLEEPPAKVAAAAAPAIVAKNPTVDLTTASGVATKEAEAAKPKAKPKPKVTAKPKAKAAVAVVEQFMLRRG